MQFPIGVWMPLNFGSLRGKARDRLLHGGVELEDGAQFRDDEEALDFLRGRGEVQVAAGVQHRRERADQNAEASVVHSLHAGEIYEYLYLVLLDELVQGLVQVGRVGYP